MVIYDIECIHNHRFEGWFTAPEDFSRQLENGQINCPACGSHEVRKLPSAAKIGRESSIRVQHKDSEQSMEKLQQYLAEHYTDVGASFPEEARRVYYGETTPRNLYGVAKPADIVELHEEGIPVIPLPPISRTKLDS